MAAILGFAIVVPLLVPTDDRIEPRLFGFPFFYWHQLAWCLPVWILQTLPAIVFGLFTRWFHRWALLAGWAVGRAYGRLFADVGDPGVRPIPAVEPAPPIR